MWMMNAYEILGVEEETSMENLREAYHRIAREVHPDAGGTVEEFLNLQKAYEILKSDERRELLGGMRIFKRRKLRSPLNLSEQVMQYYENLEALSTEGQSARRRAS